MSRDFVNSMERFFYHMAFFNLPGTSKMLLQQIYWSISVKSFTMFVLWPFFAKISMFTPREKKCQLQILSSRGNLKGQGKKTFLF